MVERAQRTAMAQAAQRLRALVMARAPGDFLGSEDMLEQQIGASKPTVRQAARLLEREGLLQVRRGSGGGYFAARPDAHLIESSVATYLEVMHARPEHLTRVASALWVETVREAAALPADKVAGLASTWRKAIARLPADADFSAILTVDRKIRSAIFALVDCPYVELIFDINANFAHRHFAESTASLDANADHAAFVEQWRAAALLQIEAISARDAEVAVLAATRTRAIIHRRLWPGDGASG